MEVYYAGSRENRGWPQAELALKIGHSRQFVSDIETERRNISLKLAKKLSTVFNISIQRFLDIE
ncbi:MAG: helix-turn-helix domain-containing protein [Spirochaetia bacterium]|nr:helix-turn-helix domain-containing protein [Spirochaetia bacterium]